MADFQQAALFEHRFWLQILGDHARMIFNALSPKETVEIERAAYFIDVFDRLLVKARQPLHEAQLRELAEQAQTYAQQIRIFKLHLLSRHLVGEIGISFTPTFLNHMTNELDIYLCILDYLLANQIPPALNAVEYHLPWLLDASGHAAAISGSLDMVEEMLQKKSQKFKNDFHAFYIKAVEMAGYIRTGLYQFPALTRFNLQVETTMQMFMCFLQELLELELSDQVLGSLYPLIPDHMLREECYYLIKLGQVSEIVPPVCDPTKPRIE
jgi:hypothetical protein